jgi:hypothetical protein
METASTIETQVQVLEQETSALMFDVHPIETVEDRQRYHEARISAADQVKRVEKVEGEICDPMYQHWKRVKAMFTKAKAPAVALIEAIDRELRADRVKQQVAVAAEQARQNKLAEKRFERQQASGKGTPLPAPVAPIVQDTGKKVTTEAGAVTWVDNFVPHIVDEKAIPREYLMPDMAKLKAACKASIEVPGVLRVNEPFQRITR